MLPIEALPNQMTVIDPLANVIDVVSFNQYLGWFNGPPEKCNQVKWTFDIQKPVIISEFGGSAPFNKHGKQEERYSEEYQEFLYEQSVEMFIHIPGLAGTAPWILNDFRSPRRVLPNIEDEFSRCGLFSEKGQKKKSFFVMKRWYDELTEKYK